MSRSATDQKIDAVKRKIEEMGFKADVSFGFERVVVGLVGKCKQADAAGQFRSMDGVEDVIPVTKHLYHTSRDYKKENSLITIGDVEVGGENIVVMAGPCAVERSDQVFFTAITVKEAGAKVIRGGAFSRIR
jgi:3-deoxy-7-phosphoheptulonate synthase